MAILFKSRPYMTSYSRSGGWGSAKSDFILKGTSIKYFVEGGGQKGSKRVKNVIYGRPLTFIWERKHKMDTPTRSLIKRNASLLFSENFPSFTYELESMSRKNLVFFWYSFMYPIFFISKWLITKWTQCFPFFSILPLTFVKTSKIMIFLMVLEIVWLFDLYLAI